MTLLTYIRDCKWDFWNGPSLQTNVAYIQSKSIQKSNREFLLIVYLRLVSSCSSNIVVAIVRGPQLEIVARIVYSSINFSLPSTRHSKSSSFPLRPYTVVPFNWVFLRRKTIRAKSHRGVARVYWEAIQLVGYLCTCYSGDLLYSVDDHRQEFLPLFRLLHSLLLAGRLRPGPSVLDHCRCIQTMSLLRPFLWSICLLCVLADCVFLRSMLSMLRSAACRSFNLATVTQLVVYTSILCDLCASVWLLLLLNVLTDNVMKWGQHWCRKWDDAALNWIDVSCQIPISFKFEWLAPPLSKIVLKFRLFRIHEMRIIRSMIPTSVSLSVCYAGGLCKNGWTDRGGDPRNSLLHGVPIPTARDKRIDAAFA